MNQFSTLLINNVLNVKSASFLRIVDEKPQSIFDHIVVKEQKMVLAPLPSVDIDPPDEDTIELKNAFLSAQSTDETYIKAIENIDFEYDEKPICHVQVTRANKPIYMTNYGKEEFFVWKEGSSKPVSLAEEHEWNKGRF